MRCDAMRYVSYEIEKKEKVSREPDRCPPSLKRQRYPNNKERNGEREKASCMRTHSF